MPLKMAFDRPSVLGGMATLGDLQQTIQNDPAMQQSERLRMLSQLGGATSGLPPWTPLGNISASLLGGVLAALVGRYFGYGILGTAVAGLLGAFGGSRAYDSMHGSDVPRGFRQV